MRPNSRPGGKKPSLWLSVIRYVPAFRDVEPSWPAPDSHAAVSGSKNRCACREGAADFKASRIPISGPAEVIQLRPRCSARGATPQGNEHVTLSRSGHRGAGDEVLESGQPGHSSRAHCPFGAPVPLYSRDDPGAAENPSGQSVCRDFTQMSMQSRRCAGRKSLRPSDLLKRTNNRTAAVCFDDRPAIIFRARTISVSPAGRVTTREQQRAHGKGEFFWVVMDEAADLKCSTENMVASTGCTPFFNMLPVEYMAFSLQARNSATRFGMCSRFATQQ